MSFPFLSFPLRSILLTPLHPTVIFDLYFTRSSPPRPFLLDLAPFSPRTDSLLFSYPELRDLHLKLQEPEEEVELRVVENELGTMQAPFVGNRYPKDVGELGEGRNVVEFAREWERRVGEAR